jgi:hypothetical protein
MYTKQRLTTEGAPVSARDPIRQRIAAFVAMVALALNLAAWPLLQSQAAPPDPFGQPICSEHTISTAGELPGGPAGALPCQFCCTLTIAASVDAPVLPAPSAIEWMQAASLIVPVQLPPPPTHRLAPPRGPSLA